MFEVIDMFGDKLTVEKYKLGLKFTAFDITHVLYESQTMELKRWLTVCPNSTLPIGDLNFSCDFGCISAYAGEEFDTYLSKENTVKFIKWVNENV